MRGTMILSIINADVKHVRHHYHIKG